MKGVIIYKGKYGSVKQYAEWLGCDLNIPVFPSDNIKGGQLGNYDFVVMGTSVYVGRLLIKDWLKRNLVVLQRKKLFLFVVCGTPGDKKEKLQRYIEINVPAEIRNSCDIYFLPGRMNMKNLSGFDRLMMNIGALFAKGSEAKKEMLMEYDDVKKENLYELVAALKKINAEKRTVISMYKAESRSN